MLTRHFTKGMDEPYSGIKWEYRDISITRPGGSVVFEQKGVHVPSFWSLNASTILAQKYFRGVLDTPGREHSLTQVIHRVVQTITARGVVDGYLVDDEQAKIFMDELSYILVHQMASFNSPVWFNIGVEGERQQSSACFILSVDDTMESILNWYREEGLIFKGGSGSGVNLSKIRSSKELLKGGGTASGPVSFMRGADASAGTIKSGGKCLAPWQKVYTAEWGAVPVSDLANRGDFTVLSYDPPAGRVKAKTARAWKSGVKQLVRVLTDKGSFDLSADHPVYLADLETVVPAGELQAGSALLATSVRPSGNGYARVWLHDGTKGRRNLHELVGDDILGRGAGQIVHHCDHNKLNNAPANLICATQAEHAKLHSMELTARGEHIFQRKDFSHAGRANGMHHSNGFWNDVAKSTAYRHAKSEELHNRGTARELQKKASRSQRMNFAYKLINEGYDITTFEGYCKARLSRGGWDRRKREAEKRIVSGFGSYENFYKELCARNHRVVSVTELPESEVYDVEVDCATPDDKTAASGHNFAIWADDGRFGTGIFVSNTRRAAKMAILDVSHPDIEEFIWCKAVEEHKARALRDAGFDMGVDGKDGFSVQYQNANNSVRVSDEFMEAVLEDKEWQLLAVQTGGVIRTMRARDLMRQIAQAAWECADPGLQFDTTINHWHTTPKAGRINGSNPCSEYLSIDNSSCNLASLNLLSFLNDDGSFDVESFVHVSQLIFTAQDILINHSDYPTEAIAENTRSYRQLGLGYANLGALLMTLGLPYDSDGGRALAATLTALMTGVAYKTSAELAARLEPFRGYAMDAESVLQVLEMHRDAMGKIDDKLVSSDLFSSATQIWDETLELARNYGVRNAQATLLAPTGTISFLMDCDTTGVEPAFSLVSYKKLVGGGNMVLPVQCVEAALVRLGYNESDQQAILEAIVNGSSLVSEPNLLPEHRSVFATAVGENSISATGHIKMMAAVQPFLSGAISKTVNLPEETTVEEVEETYIEAWELGLKAVALYRDNCKVAQPLSSTKDEVAKDAALETETWEALAAEAEAECSTLRHRVAELEEELAKPKVVLPVRRRLPRHRRSRTYAFRVGESEGYVTVGEYDDGRPGELFAKVSKQGSTLAGVMDAFSIAISLGLQHGVPLETYVRKFTNMRFEPAGMTDDPDLRIASSLVDYIFRRVAMDYLDSATRSELGIHSSRERQAMVELPYSSTNDDSVGEGSAEIDASPTDAAVKMSVANYYATMEALGSSHKEQVSDEHSHSRIVDAPLCYECGTAMLKTGSCWCCPGCGASGGCS